MIFLCYILKLIFCLIVISYAKDDLISDETEDKLNNVLSDGKVESNDFIIENETPMKSRSKRAMYYRNDPFSMRNDMKRRLWLARNPIFGDFGRYSRIFNNVFGIGNRPSPRRFKNDYYSDYNDYTENYDYPIYSNNFYDYNYGFSHRPGFKNGRSESKNAKKYVGVKLSNKFSSNDELYGLNSSLSKDRTSKLSSILNKIKFGNETLSQKKAEPLSNSLLRTKQTLSDLKKMRTPSNLVEIKFPKIDKLASKIASNMDITQVSKTTIKPNLVQPKTSTKDYFFSTTTPRTTTRVLKKTSTIETYNFEDKENAFLKSPFTINSTQSSTNRRKFSKIDKLASRIVSHFI